MSDRSVSTGAATAAGECTLASVGYDAVRSFAVAAAGDAVRAALKYPFGGFPDSLLPSDETASAYLLLCAAALLLSATTAAVIAVARYNRSCHRRCGRNQRLKRELDETRNRLRYLQDRLSNNDDDDGSGNDDDDDGSSSSSSNDDSGGAGEKRKKEKKKKKEIRLFMDGAFDLLHYGHMNAFRLARSLGTRLVVGVNSDASIAECKGCAPLMNDDERLAMVAACKFVDDVVPDCPYIMNERYLQHVLTAYDIDYVIHGDDPCLVDGKDVYAAAKRAGKYRTIPRTEGVSTTDIVGRMLLMTKEHHLLSSSDDDCCGDDDYCSNSGSDGQQEQQKRQKQKQKKKQQQQQKKQATTEQMKRSAAAAAAAASESQKHQHRQQRMNHDHDDETDTVLGHRSKFLTTSRMLQLFSADAKAPSADMKIVYIDGAWDLFHPGHVALLKAARELGDYLIVGIHGDRAVNRARGMNLPLMNLHERVLSVLGCRYADDVLIDAPWTITTDMIASLNVSAVVCCRGSSPDGNDDDDCYYFEEEEEGEDNSEDNPNDNDRHREDDQNDNDDHNDDDDENLVAVERHTTNGSGGGGGRRRSSGGSGGRSGVDDDVVPSRFRQAQAAGILSVMDRPSNFSLGSIVNRIRRNQEAFQAKFERKMNAETSFYRDKKKKQQQQQHKNNQQQQ